MKSHVDVSGFIPLLQLFQGFGPLWLLFVLAVPKNNQFSMAFAPIWHASARHTLWSAACGNAATTDRLQTCLLFGRHSPQMHMGRRSS